MTDLTKLTIKESLKGLKNKEFTSKELTEGYIKNIEDNRYINAFVSDTFDRALDSAKKADENIANGKMRALEGIPLGIKDLYCTKGVRTTSASKMLEDFVPPYESTVTQKLWDEGALMLGKLNMDEFAMGSANTNSNFGPVVNPFKKKGSDEELTPGGSSGGSSAAVAANLCAAATASDTGGSIRQPASFTGTVGVKPSYGRCSRYGMIAFASSLDQAGIIAKDVADAALVQKVICGFDEKDSTCVDVAVPDFDALLNSDVKGKKIGIPHEYQELGVPEEIQKAWDKAKDILKSKGAEVVDISLPHTKYGAAVYYIIAPAECSSNLARYDGVKYGYRTNCDGLSIDEMYSKTRTEAFGEEVQRRIMIGTYVLSAGYYDAYYKKALKVRRLIANDFKEAFKEVDAIVTPATPGAAFSIKDSLNLTHSDPIKLYLNDIFTIPVNLAGLPAMSVPVAKDHDDLPIGIQIITKNFDEQTMFDVALALEEGAK